MSPLDALSPDQRAVLQLVLKQGKRYEELAALLRIEPSAVRDRAVAALDALGPETDLVAGRRAELTDWLLAQQDPAAAQQTRDYLSASPSARAWAGAIAAELQAAGLGRRPPAAAAAAQAPDAETPPSPAEPGSAEPPPAAPPTGSAAQPAGATGAPEPAALALPTNPASEGEGRLPGFGDPTRTGDRGPVSKLGGAILLAGIAIVLAVVLVWALNRDDGETSTVGQTQPSTTATTLSEEPTIAAQVNLRAADGGEALGVANVLEQGGQRAVAIQAQDLPRNTDADAYAVWLTDGPEDAVARLGFAPAVGRNGRLEGAATLPEDAADYGRLVISRETAADPQEPDEVVLSGRLRLG